MELEIGKLVAGRWRVVAELDSEKFTSYRVADADGRVGEMLLVENSGEIKPSLEKLRGIQHNNIVTPYEAGTWLKSQYYVRELLAMEPLLHWFERNKPLEEDQVVAIGCQLALVIRELESRDVRRCEITPETVYITTEGLVKVDPLEYLLTQSKDERFAAPEEKEGLADLRSSVYQMGLMLSRLSLDETYAGDLGQIVTYVRSGKENLLISPQYHMVLKRMLAQKPKDRHISGEELLAELDQVLAMDSQQAVFNDEMEPDRWHEDKRFWLYTAVGLTALLIIMIIIQTVIF